MPAADARAVEVFLDDNMLALLRTTFPVKSTNLRVDRTSQLQLYHVKMVQNLKNKIERNWQLSQAAKNPYHQYFQLAFTRKQEAV
ncbi:MAG: hypothetical protein ALECFALPRED_001973 [Alectoria fallacina]|uniref:Uncharacterized protein n=1 Tax=Alectoria fallacina TaxID=1903189 RepID=A0A8H3FE22_9LECA|nr:MAG: hypothetical protein ALECFALPRED_001973 [Alectoria fallacina]